MIYISQRQVYFKNMCFCLHNMPIIHVLHVILQKHMLITTPAYIIAFLKIYLIIFVLLVSLFFRYDVIKLYSFSVANVYHCIIIWRLSHILWGLVDTQIIIFYFTIIILTVEIIMYIVTHLFVRNLIEIWVWGRRDRWR